MAEEHEYPTRRDIERVMNQAVIGLETATVVARNEARYEDVEAYLISETTVEITSRERRSLLEDLPSYSQWEPE